MLGVRRSFRERCSDLSEEYIPGPYVIAIVLTFVATGTAIANLRARDSIGCSVIAMVAGICIVSGWLTLFFVVL